MAELKVYTANEVCDILKVTKRTLYNYIKAEQIQATRMGREWRFTEQAVKDFMERGTSPDYLEKLEEASSRK